LPLVTDMGLSAVWFGIFLVRAMEIGFIHPPIGMNLYVIQGVVPEVSLGRIFKGVLPFLVADLMHLVLLIVFRVSALALPRWLGYCASPSRQRAPQWTTASAVLLQRTARRRTASASSARTCRSTRWSGAAGRSVICHGARIARRPGPPAGSSRD